MKNHKTQKGFTLIELLVVIGILAVLLAITLIAINPAKQFAQANNTQRASDVNTVLNAINQYMADNKGALPPDLTAGGCTAAAPCTLSNDATATKPVDLCQELVSGYLAALPGDPKDGTSTPLDEAACAVPTTYNTTYTIYQSASNNRITIAAPGAELGVVIQVTR